MSLTGISHEFWKTSEYSLKCVPEFNFTRESSFKGTPLDWARLRRLRFSVALSGCEQDKTARGEIRQRHRHLNLPLHQKFHLLPQAHHNFEISLMYFLYSLYGHSSPDDVDDISAARQPISIIPEVDPPRPPPKKKIIIIRRTNQARFNTRPLPLGFRNQSSRRSPRRLLNVRVFNVFVWKNGRA